MTFSRKIADWRPQEMTNQDIENLIQLAQRVRPFTDTNLTNGAGDQAEINGKFFLEAYKLLPGILEELLELRRKVEKTKGGAL